MCFWKLTEKTLEIHHIIKIWWMFHYYQRDYHMLVDVTNWEQCVVSWSIIIGYNWNMLRIFGMPGFGLNMDQVVVGTVGYDLQGPIFRHDHSIVPPVTCGHSAPSDVINDEFFHGIFHQWNLHPFSKTADRRRKHDELRESQAVPSAEVWRSSPRRCCCRCLRRHLWQEQRSRCEGWPNIQ